MRSIRLIHPIRMLLCPFFFLVTPALAMDYHPGDKVALKGSVLKIATVIETLKNGTIKVKWLGLDDSINKDQIDTMPANKFSKSVKPKCIQGFCSNDKVAVRKTNTLGVISEIFDDGRALVEWNDQAHNHGFDHVSIAKLAKVINCKNKRNICAGDKVALRGKVPSEGKVLEVYSDGRVRVEWLDLANKGTQELTAIKLLVKHVDHSKVAETVDNKSTESKVAPQSAQKKQSHSREVK